MSFDFSHIQLEEVPQSVEESDGPLIEGLRIDSVRLENFRNYERFSLSNLGALTILVGPNAVGKTSAIEAIQMVTACKSFRTNQFEQMQRWGCPHSSIDASIRGNGRNLDIHLSIDQGKRNYQLNGKNKRIQDLKGLLPAVSFSPDDLNLAKGAHSIRRSALDNLGSQLSKNFYAVKNDYAKLIKQKNKALKDELPDFYLDSIDDTYKGCRSTDYIQAADYRQDEPCIQKLI